MSEGINGSEMAKETVETFDAWERWRKVKEHAYRGASGPDVAPDAVETGHDADRAIIEESVRDQIRGAYKLHLENSLPEGHPLLKAARDSGFDPKSTMEEAVRQLNSAARQVDMMHKIEDESSDVMLMFADTARSQFSKLFEWARGSEGIFQMQFTTHMTDLAGSDGWSISRSGSQYVLNFDSLSPSPRVIRGAIQAIEATKDEMLQGFFDQAGAEDVIKANEGMGTSLIKSLNRLADDIDRIRRERMAESEKAGDHLERDLSPAAKKDKKFQEIMSEYKRMKGQLATVGSVLGRVVAKVSDPKAKEALLKMSEDERLLALVRRMAGSEGVVSGLESERKAHDATLRKLLDGVYEAVRILYKAHDGSDIDMKYLIDSGDHKAVVDYCTEMLRKLEGPIRQSGKKAESLSKENIDLNAELMIIRSRLQNLAETDDVKERIRLHDEIERLRYELEMEMGEAGRARRSLADYNSDLKNIFISLDAFEILPRLDKAVYHTPHSALISDRGSDMSRRSTFDSEAEDFMEWLDDFNTIINCYLDDIQTISRGVADGLGMPPGDVRELVQNPEHRKALQNAVMATGEYSEWLENSNYLRERLSAVFGQKFSQLSEARNYIRRLGNSCARELEYIRDHVDSDFGYKRLVDHLAGDRELYDATDIRIKSSGKDRVHRTDKKP